MSDTHFVMDHHYKYACQECGQKTARGTKRACEIHLRLHYKVSHKGIKPPKNIGASMPPSGLLFRTETTVVEGVRSIAPA